MAADQEKIREMWGRLYGEPLFDGGPAGIGSYVYIGNGGYGLVEPITDQENPIYKKLPDGTWVEV